MRTANIIRCFFGAGLILGGLIQYILSPPMSEMALEELGRILLVTIIGIHFLHHGLISDTRERLRALESRIGPREE